MKSEKQVRAIVEKVLGDVKRRGDLALIHLAKKIDGVQLTPSQIRVSESNINRAFRLIHPELTRAIKACSRRIKDFHQEEKKRLPISWMVNKNGVRLGQVIRAVESAGLYVPGGRFSYPSTVLMTAIPAKMAGVKRVVMVTPSARLTPEILVAAKIAGVDEIYRVGGPAAIAALAYGTKKIRPVDLIVGPGNALVTEAKRQLFGRVGIDLLAGPSELVVVADHSSNSSYIAQDLSAQAEHDPDSTAYLISLSRRILREVKNKVPAKLQRQCRFILETSISKALERADKVAGEHVQLMVKNPRRLLAQMKNGGTFFLNASTPAVLGDYWAGPSHVLPTGQSARFASGLSVATFLKRSGVVEASAAAVQKNWKTVARLAKAEGLLHHAESVRMRSVRLPLRRSLRSEAVGGQGEKI